MPVRKLIVIAVAISFVIVAIAIGFVVAVTFFIFRLVDQTPAHVCGLAMVQRSPAAIKLLGTPIVQHGLTGGRSSSTNGEDDARMTFWVRGPLGDAFVVSDGHRSPLNSHLNVRIGRNGKSVQIYSGPFDCPELHR